MQTSPEIELIILCANPLKLNAGQNEKIKRLLQDGPDWETIINRSARLGVTSLVYRQLKERFRDDTPAAALKQLKQFHFYNTARSMILSKTLLSILDTFQSHGIFAVPFKGPVLSSYLYGSDDLRSFNDLDIFVFSKDIPAAKKLLLKAGYQTVHSIPKKLEDFFYSVDHALDFFHPTTKINLDLQWKLFRIYTTSSLTLEKLSQGIKIIPFFEKKIHSLGDEDLLLFLCAHGAKHHWERLEFVTSITALLEKAHIDWPYVLDLASSAGCKRIVLMGVHLASELFGSSLKNEIIVEIQKDKAIRVLTRQVLDFYRFDKCLKPEFTQNIDLSKFQIDVRDRIKDKLLFAFRAVTIPSYKDFKIITAPIICYYFIKPVRLTVKLITYFINRAGRIIKA